jgi:AcrR family transcriptional regulator
MVAPRTERQYEQMREGSRERILESARELFAEHGFAATSVRRIAERAGISQGLLYNYFDGKDALLRAIFERTISDVAESLSAARTAAGAGAGAGAAAGAAEDVRAALDALVRSAFAIVAEHRAFWQLSYQLRMQPAVQASLGEGMREWSNAIRAELERLLGSAVATDCADGADGADARAIAVEARVLFAAIDGAAQHYVMDPDGYPVDAVAAAITRRFVSPVKEEAGHDT